LGLCAAQPMVSRANSGLKLWYLTGI
jgi:hypothetical protein